LTLGVATAVVAGLEVLVVVVVVFVLVIFFSVFFEVARLFIDDTLLYSTEDGGKGQEDEEVLEGLFASVLLTFMMVMLIFCT
jgi:hypothetical protein